MCSLNLDLSSLVAREESRSTLVRFEDTTDENVPRLRYSVPLPGAMDGRYFIIFEPKNVVWTSNATSHDSVIDNLNAFIGDNNFRPVSEIAHIRNVGRHTTDDVIREEAAILSLRKIKSKANDTVSIERRERRQLEYNDEPKFVKRDNNELFIQVKDLEIPFSEVRSAAKNNKVLTVYRTFGGNLRYRFTNIVISEHVKDMKPRFVIVEHYKLSSFFEDYGAGRTLGVFSLLPGEETTIKERHWRREETKEKSASSVFDSFGSESADEFEEVLESENTDKESYNESLDWYVKASASVNFGVGSASVEGGASGSTASAREQLSKNASKTTSKHAERASSKRDISVTTEGEESTSEEFETIKERKLKNTNLSRTLNIVIRELNQEFTTYLSLVDITIAFANKGGVFDEYAIHEIDKMLERYVEPPPEGPVVIQPGVPIPIHRDVVKTKLLEQIRKVVDFEGQEHDFLEEENDHFGGTYWRIKRRRSIDSRNPFYEGRDDIPVVGVVLNIDRNTIRTDALIIDSLLGHGVALDNYALGMQQENLRNTQLENMKTELALHLIDEGNEQKIEAFRSLFGSVDKELLTQVAVGDTGNE